MPSEKAIMFGDSNCKFCLLQIKLLECDAIGYDTNGDLNSNNLAKYEDSVIDMAYRKCYEFLTSKNPSIYGNLTIKQLSNWFQVAIEKSLNVEDKYKRVNRSFHQAVWDRLMIMGPKQTEEEGGGYEIVANILCNYAQVKQAAQKVQKYPKFKDDKNIQSLKFSDGW